MTTITLTRPLLERYLRATGYKYDRAMLAAIVARDGIHDAALAYVGIGSIFRLGLCAAAEELPIEPASRAMYEHLLTAAGITPEAWEAAK